MLLSHVLPDEAEFDSRAAGIEVTGISADSRAVRPGEIFVAIAGTKTDGSRFVADAVARGASAVLGETPQTAPLPGGVPFVHVPNVRRALALTAARLFPRQPEIIAAVTGTSGKTSVAAFLRQIWQRLGHSAASLGTVGIVAPHRETYGSLTTPDPVQLHNVLQELADESVTRLAMEASSHGLHQHRLDGVRVSVAAFTNLSRDHLDYHPTLDEYLDAKLRLFSDVVRPDGSAVVNADDENASRVIAAVRKRKLRLLTIGRAGEALRLVHLDRQGFGQQLIVECDGVKRSVDLPLVGAFQVDNALVAAGMAIAAGDKAADVFGALPHLKGAKGRLELVGTRNGAPIFVDYAHKPDALAKALQALRPYARRLIVIFGAGGDRDAGKRPIMGAIAAENADEVIVTDDNPRSESAATIRAAILMASPGAREIGDRAEAIRAGVAGLQSGDVLLIAGKGHETGQIIGDRVLPFSDHEAVAAALGEIAA